MSKTKEEAAHAVEKRTGIAWPELSRTHDLFSHRCIPNYCPDGCNGWALRALVPASGLPVMGNAGAPQGVDTVEEHRGER